MKKLLLIFVCLISCGLLQANENTNTSVFIYEPDPLTQAIEDNNFEQVKTLIENGTDVTKPSTSRRPVLCVAKEQSRQNSDIIKLLIEKGADVNTKCYHGGTVLHSVVFKEQNKDLIKFLIEKGADINAQDDSGSTPLFYAGTKEIAQLLIENGADVNIKNKDRDTCLMFMLPREKDKKREKMFKYVLSQTKNADNNKLLLKAVEYDNLNIVKTLVKNGADVNAKDEIAVTITSKDKEATRYVLNKKSSALAKANNSKIAKYLVSKGAKINTVYEAIAANNTELAKDFISKGHYTEKQLTELIFDAVNYGANDIAKYLIDKGVDVNARVGDKTPLHIATRTGNLKTVKLLVENGADINAEVEGANPLLFSIFNKDKNNRIKIMKYLISKGANVNTRLGSFTLLWYAASYGVVEEVKILLENGASLKNLPNVATTPIQAVLTPDNNLKDVEAILKLMIAHGADMNMEIPYTPNVTLLYHHILNNHLELVKLLIKLGAKVNSNSEISKFYVAMAVGNDNKDMVTLLLDNNAEINAKNYNGKTALDFAKNDDMRQFLISRGAKSGKDLP